MSKTQAQHAAFAEAIGHLQDSTERLRGGDIRPEVLQYADALRTALLNLHHRLKTLEEEAEEEG